MAGTLLSVANSAMYSRYGSASSTIDAIVRLGYSKLKRFALAQTFARVFRFGRPASVWSPTRFHLHSSAVGMAGELLADRLAVVNGENAFLAGLVHDLGKLLFAVAMLRVLIWGSFGVYGEHYVAIAFAVSISVIGCTTCGTLAGAMLPFVLRKFGADPASASAPFVATLVDVSGILIYFGIANLMLRGVLPL